MTQVTEKTLVGRRLEHEAEMSRKSDKLELRLRELGARVEAATEHAQAFSPHLVEALRQ